MNRAILIGRVGRDPVVKETEGNRKWANFPLATNKYVKGENVTTWHNIKVFDSKLAEMIENRVEKGTLLALEGEIEVSVYEKDGEKKTSVSVVVPPFNGLIDILAGWKQTEQKTEQTNGPDDGIPF